MIRRIFLTKKTQSLVEMGVVGAVVLGALGILVSYVTQLNSEQYQLQEAFRLALKRSHDMNKVTAYGMYDDARQASVGNPIIGDKILGSGAGYVMWAIPSVLGVGESPSKQGFVGVNFHPLNPRRAQMGAFMGEYPFQQSGAVSTDFAVSTTSDNVNININQGRTSSSHSAGSADVTPYKIDGATYPQARGYGGSRSMSGGN